MSITRTFDLLQKYKDNYFQKEDALAGKVNGQWVKYSSVDYINNSNFISYGLLALGIKRGDKIATISNNRPEWNFIDLGMAQTGAIHVPIFTSLDKEGYKIILTHAEVKFVFVSDKSLSNKISSLVDEIATLEKVYSFDDVPGIDNWKAVLELGKQNEHKFKTELEIIKSEIKETDAVTLIYTSGTTGNSKGVLLSHRNLISNAKSASEVFHLQPHHRYLSILPICHVGERMGNYQSQYSGCSIYYAESLGSISSDLLDIKPHGFGAVPASAAFACLPLAPPSLAATGHGVVGLCARSMGAGVLAGPGLSDSELACNALGRHLPGRCLAVSPVACGCRGGAGRAKPGLGADRLGHAAGSRLAFTPGYLCIAALVCLSSWVCACGRFGFVVGGGSTWCGRGHGGMA